MHAFTLVAAALSAAAPAAAQLIHGDGTYPPNSPVGDRATGALVYNGWEFYNAARQSNAVPASSPNAAAFFTSGEFQTGQDVLEATQCFRHLSHSAIPRVSAQRSDGTTVVQDLAYHPKTFRNGFITTIFPGSFSNLERLTIQVLSSSAPVGGVAPLVDNNHYLAFIRS
ncbi:hypothetical protein AC579_6064 [Pseudocercospora musae]|uniref:Uncharacterized protein n=1 Tax=Pseudocercospora musae TaxID=113226 RepID=A0A139HZS6_9PEZI|nr:hypothetical protein AC579_6064 [Pseudocercospora musae]